MIYKIYNDQYVAAIIEGTFELGQWLISVPEERVKTLRVEPFIGQKSYPITLMEYSYKNRRIFMHDTDGRLKGTLGGLPGIKLLCTYTIDKDFRGDPKNPGLDYMGILNHEHEPEDE